MSNRKRAVLLGEDRAHREFLERICELVGWEIVDEKFAPSGAEAASKWVLKQFDELVQDIVRSSRPGLRLLVIIDGDKKNWQIRRRELLRHCTMQLPAKDPFALLVPAWSVDTWALFFKKNQIVPEGQESKPLARNLYRSMPHQALAPGVPRDRRPPPGWRPAVLKALVKGFLGEDDHASLPSLAASRKHFRRALG